MRYSLLSRFRGAVLGAAVGEVWGRHERTSSSLQWPSFQTGAGQKPEKDFGPPAPEWGTLAAFAAESLIQKGQLDLEDWKKACRQAVNSSSIEEREWAGAAIATLPVVLFFHEDDAKLLSMLEQALGEWEHASFVRDGTIGLAVSIAQALKEKLNPASLIPQIAAYFQERSGVSDTRNAAFAKQLLQVQTWLEEGLCLEAIAARARHPEESAQCTPIALALYCFLRTPEDLRLSVMRAARIGIEPSVTAALTGAISGAYNSTCGIPVGWRSQLLYPNASVESNLSFSPVKAVAEVLQLGDRLFAAWCGAGDATAASLDASGLRAIAAVSVTPPR